MRRLTILLVGTIALAFLAPPMARSRDLPTQVGSCVRTKISRLEHRLQSGENGPFIPDSGSAVRFANGGYEVGYDELRAIHRARVGDPVLMCLVYIPSDCPPGDARGRTYTTTDFRTLESWTLADAEHSCGGA